MTNEQAIASIIEQARQAAAKTPAPRRGGEWHPCAGGCGAATRSHWAPGHDAKAKSRAIRQIRAGQTPDGRCCDAPAAE